MNRIFRLSGLFLFLDQHQHFFQFAEVGGGLDLYIQKQIFAISHLGHLADRQPLGENLVSAAGQNRFADLNLLIAHHSFQCHLAIRSSAQDALQPRLLEHRTHAAALIADQQHLRHRRVDQQHFAHDAV